jgi:uncharacterized protein (TIGR02172 family)
MLNKFIIFAKDKHLKTIMNMIPEIIDLKDYEESGGGYSATSYNHRNGKTMMKMYAEDVPSSVPEQEFSTAKAVMEMGLKTPKPIRIVTDGKRIGTEFERISPKISFASAISQEPEKLELYAVVFAKMCKQLHSTPCDKSIFPSAYEYYRGLIDTRDFLCDDYKNKLRAFIDKVPETNTCIHGDLHFGNVITNGKDNFWIDLADFAYGNPLFDLSMFYLVCNDPSEEQIQKYYHTNHATALKFWAFFLREYCGANTPEEVEAANKKIKPFLILRFLHFSNLHPNNNPFISKKIDELMHVTDLN